MKKLLTILMMLTLSFCLAACSAAETIIVDPVLERVDAQGIPQGLFSDLGNERILIWNEMDGTEVIHHLRTGETTPVTVREEDKDYWITSLVAAYAAEGELLSANDIAILANEDTQTIFDECNKINGGMHITSHGQRYALIREYSAVLDIDTGVVSIPPHIEYSLSITPWDQILGTQINSQEVICCLIGKDGKEQYRAVISEEGYVPMDTYPLEDAVLVSFILRDKETETSTLKFVLLDRKLNIQSVAQTDGNYTKLLTTKQAYFCAETGQILMQTHGMAASTADRKTFTLTPKGPYLDGLVVLDMQEQTCVRVDNAPEYSHIIGMSADGSYALITSSENCLYKLDMRSLIFTQQMSAQEIAEAGLGFLGSPSWDGGEYAVSPQCIFRVKER